MFLLCMPRLCAVIPVFSELIIMSKRFSMYFVPEILYHHKDNNTWILSSSHNNPETNEHKMRLTVTDASEGLVVVETMNQIGWKKTVS